ncbi:hypothetical protein HYFRA_00011794 [Hymenoscyphus fraxineus]|uniref:Phosphoribosylaminoimidazole-succinocarboxamide synthase n=1 Tax=Hymenoscyphus fraxineus TaxID=746836 RepID=A0A9N9L684_9HELO|nr:hypothetical protein HYFRA_00011794 [Hymenoscyphus fraxineus]
MSQDQDYVYSYTATDERNSQRAHLLPPTASPSHHITPTPQSLTSGESQVTVIPWLTPISSHQQIPNLVSPQGSSSQSFHTLQPNTLRNSFGVDEESYASDTPLVVPSDEDQPRTHELAASAKGEALVGMENESDNANANENVVESPTPVDDTPYIRFAIDQLTRDEEIKALQRASVAASSESYPVDRIVDYAAFSPRGHLSTQQQREELAIIRKHRSTPTPNGRLFAHNPTRPLSEESIATPIPWRQTLSAGPDIFLPVDPPPGSTRYPPLTFVPAILRPLSILLFSFLCLLMIIAIMFCAIYSNSHRGLYDWMGGVTGARYFIFGFLPQIFAACILVYAHEVMSATRRILPYVLMAMNDAYMRSSALFLDIYPQALLWPVFFGGPVTIRSAQLLLWLAIGLIPLHGCLFSVIQVDGVWRWTTVQGVAWTLIALYVLILIGLVMTGVFFFRRSTGLMWDPTSLADIIALLPRSNCLNEYSGTDTMDRQELREKLALRSDRLGYWMTQHKNKGLFYCVGEEGGSPRRYTLEYGRISEKKTIDATLVDVEGDGELYSSATRFRHLPWLLRDKFVILWVVAGSLTLLSLIIVSFLPSTLLANGFKPLVPAAPDSEGFSPSNFLYSFIPSVIGILLYLCIQSADMTIRKLQPWAELGQLEGSPADKSLLLDYTATAPLLVSVKAIRAGHFRVAFLSGVSFISILLPILGGGLFFPLTSQAGDVRMFPNLPSFYICLAILIIYVIALCSLIPNRTSMKLPHGVSCLAEIFSFAHASKMLDDAAFDAPRSKEDLVTGLTVTPEGHRHATMYGFGMYRGRYGKDCLGVDKLGRPGSTRMSIIGGR